MDAEYLDELERRGDGVLEEERWRAETADYGWEIDVYPDTRRLRIDVVAGWRPTLDAARRFANAILSEVEIIERGEEIE